MNLVQINSPSPKIYDLNVLMQSALSKQLSRDLKTFSRKNSITLSGTKHSSTDDRSLSKNLLSVFLLMN